MLSSKPLIAHDQASSEHEEFFILGSGEVHASTW